MQFECCPHLAIDACACVKLPHGAVQLPFGIEQGILAQSVHLQNIKLHFTGQRCVVRMLHVAEKHARHSLFRIASLTV